MTRTTRWLIAFLAVCSIVVLWTVRGSSDRATAAAQTRKPLMVTRLYTAADGLTHAEDVELKLNGEPQNQISEMLNVKGAEIHRTSPGRVNSWHRAPRRQYVITLSGRGEIELAGGKKFLLEPGHIELAEDLTGQGHITRVIGNEDRVTIELPLAETPAK